VYSNGVSVYTAKSDTIGWKLLADDTLPWKLLSFAHTGFAVNSFTTGNKLLQKTIEEQGDHKVETLSKS
jgi:hypothetical protein